MVSHGGRPYFLKNTFGEKFCRGENVKVHPCLIQTLSFVQLFIVLLTGFHLISLHL